MALYPSIESTPITFEDDELYKLVDDDYVELKRGFCINKVTMKNGNEVEMWTPRKRKNGERRRKFLFLNLLIRRMICPTATLDYLLYCGLYELDYYTDNTQDPITKYEIAQIAVNAYLADLNKWQKLKEWNRKTFKVNKEHCKKNGINARRAALTIANTMRKAKASKKHERIKELYDIELTDKQNIEEMEKNGLKISLITLKRWKKENGIRKYKKRVSTANTENVVTAQSQTACNAVGDVKSTSMGNLSTKEEKTQQNVREVAKTEREVKIASIMKNIELYKTGMLNAKTQIEFDAYFEDFKTNLQKMKALASTEAYNNYRSQQGKWWRETVQHLKFYNNKTQQPTAPTVEDMGDYQYHLESMYISKTVEDMTNAINRMANWFGRMESKYSENVMEKYLEKFQLDCKSVSRTNPIFQKWQCDVKAA